MNLFSCFEQKNRAKLQMIPIMGIALFCSACVSSKSIESNKLMTDNKQQSNVKNPERLISFFAGTWQLVSINGKPLTQSQANHAPSFTITGMNVTGFDGCNQFFGRIDQPANIAATRMGCAPETIKIPLDLDNLLAHLQTGTFSGNTLTIPAQGRFPSSVFKRSVAEYWTKERMDKAKPPEMGIIVDPNVPQTTDEQDSSVIPGSAPGCADPQTENCKK